MKITYEFDFREESDDFYDIQVFQNSKKMFIALQILDEYAHGLRKEHITDDKEQIINTLSDIIFDSGIGDFE